ncbi:MAG: branched chain amino acid aminotransferase [Nitrospinaceae bacterium]|nr:MAG: branched chain amino acid aminotransferase [Nitrospinaceae bacterium]
MGERIVFLNGLFMAQSSATVSVLDRGFCYGDGLFETMRCYGNRVFCLDEHLERLYQSLDLIYLDVPMTREEMRSALYETIKRNQVPDSMVRLTISRGEQSTGFHIDPETSPTFVIVVRELEPLPAEWYEKGIDISLFPETANRIGGLARQIKSCNFLTYIIVREMAHSKKSVEGILLDDNNRVTEGTTSNVFMVKDGVLKTPDLNPHILPGITRQVVLKVAEKNGIPVSLNTIHAEDIYHADEVFVTNSRIEVMPVRNADGKTIGSGRPGEVTRLLHAEFLKSVEGFFQKC